MPDVDRKIAQELPFEGEKAWRHVAPLPGGRSTVGAVEGAALILGILAISLHWIVFFRLGLLLFAVPLILSVLAIVFGFSGARKVFRKGHERKDGEAGIGLAGLYLGILSLMFTVAWLVIAQTYLWGWEL